ncbi:unnamed protein product [Parnassius mnemosyne]|uniref:Reverse transcriptase domain-containing protein n=1 Tax=Parnassius mnemosyne TaxID=213953 RepID=A0AAV1L9J3_9NEOP
MKVWERIIERRMREECEITQNQFGFMPGRGTTDAIFALRQLCEKYKRVHKDLHMVFVDLEKAYDRVPREVLWWALKMKGMPGKYVRLVRAMYRASRTCVRSAAGTTGSIDVAVGLHQGSALSPYLFLLIMDALTSDLQDEAPWCMLFADDIVLVGEEGIEVQSRLTGWQRRLESVGLKISRYKTEYLCCDFGGLSSPVPMSLDGAILPICSDVKYLGSLIQGDGGIDRAVQHRINAGFKAEHNRQYASDVEHAKRLNIFRQNLRFINSNNRARRGFTLSVNHLADRTDDELAALRGLRYNGSIPMGLPFPYGESELKEMQMILPPEIDWRLVGAVSPVKDQIACGSCWSFGAIGAVEGAFFLSNGGHLVRFSEQALIDCSWGFGNNGCAGGMPFYAYQWIMKHGLPTEEDYGGYLNELAIFEHGPISVGIDASHKSFEFYSHGVYFEPRCKNRIEDLDHAVLAVGYGTLNGLKYWLIKNSWSNLWGDNGYVLMSSLDNNCGVETVPTYVLI